MAAQPSAFLFVVNNAQALGWIVTEKRIAFRHRRRATVERMTAGQELFIYTSTRCFQGYSDRSSLSPGSLRPRVVALLALEGAPEFFEEELHVAGDSFALGARVQVKLIAKASTGPDFTPLVRSLHAFDENSAWHLRLRAGLIPLDQHDRDLLADELASAALDEKRVLTDYVQMRLLTKGRS